jgi:hypothetical protein
MLSVGRRLGEPNYGTLCPDEELERRGIHSRP